MASERQQIVDGINYLLNKTNMSASGLATKAKVSPSTVTRFMAKEDAPMLGTRTLNKLAQAARFTDWGAVRLSQQGIREPDKGHNEAPPISHEVALDAFDRALDIGLEMGYSREQAKRAAKAASEAAYASKTNVSDHLIEHFLEAEDKKC